MRTLRVIVLLAALLLAACVTSPQSPPPPTMPAVASDNSAVIALAKNARDDMSAGQLGAAAANLERALRIEPRNPTLWHELARVSLHQGQPGQAVQFAGKSNSFAADNRELRAANWRLIGQALTQSGDQSGAEAAFAKAAQLDTER
jgi:Tfp pilus assembly protein PilF